MSEPMLHILHLEDDPLDSELAKEMLQAGGLNVEIDRVDSLAALTEALGRRRYALVLSDYTVPGTDPLEALRMVRRDYPDLPVVFLSGTIGEERATETLKLGANDYVLKQRMERLAFTVRRAMAEAQEFTRRRQAEEALKAAKETAEEANRAKDRFIAVLSHELRTPLTAVLPALDALREIVPDEAKEYVEIASRNVELEARLIDDLLDMTRIARGKIELQRRIVDLCTVVERATQVCQADIDARGVHFRLRMDDGPHMVDADPIRLEQVFWNLIQNAVKFTPPGGCVGVRVERIDGRSVTQVCDSGAGIESEALARIFNSFEQETRSITRKYGGLGLGLAISKALVEMHGGTIRATSDGKDRGAAFVAEFPLVETGHQPQKAPARPSIADIEPLRILLVEDHDDTARIVSLLLRKAGHTVQRAATVAAARELAESETFDVLLSDLGLPDGSGHDLMRHLVSTGRAIPALALSGYGTAADIQRSRDAGFMEHMVKPVTFAMLQGALDRLSKAVAGRTERAT